MWHDITDDVNLQPRLWNNSGISNLSHGELVWVLAFGLTSQSANNQAVWNRMRNRSQLLIFTHDSGRPSLQNWKQSNGTVGQ